MPAPDETYGDASAALARARDEFPILRDWVYLDSAGLGLLPARHVARLQAETDRDLTEPLVIPGARGGPLRTELRGALGNLVAADATDIGLVPTTAHGINVFAAGFDWRSGDEVICLEDDFPTCVAPFRQLQRRGVRVVLVPTDTGRCVDLDVLESAFTSRTRAVCLSAVNSDSGARVPLAEVGLLCRERQAWFIVDGIQALGALDIDVERDRIDILTAQAYKFLIGGLGIGLCYVRPELAAVLTPPITGWHNADRITDDGLPSTVSLAETSAAQLCEPGAISHVSVAGLLASLSLIAEIGTIAIEQHVLTLAAALERGFRERGLHLRAGDPRDLRSHIVTVGSELLPPSVLRQRLVEQRVIGSARQDSLRFAPHFYNDLGDVDRLFEAVDRALAAT